MIRKLKSGQYRLYSRKLNPKTGKRRNLGTFDTREEAQQPPLLSPDPIERLDLLAALRALSPRERALLWLTCAEGYEHRDVARMMGMAHASVRVLLFRARRKLARLMERER